ncbi:MAG TPA: D-alanyl-D-alanine carboxypeptidase family protein [Gaiellaceae bacterium]|nr:D-alanyl-D-alanine carboxypeptidase family protein [Gaiellaceae bacterium]
MKFRLAVLAAAVLLFAPSAVAGVPQVSARAYIVENGVTGDVLAQRNDDERLPIASITKLMTVLVTLQNAKLDDVVTVSRRAAAVGESSIYLQKGDQLTVEELIEAALIQSANDAAVALAEHVGGTQGAFVAMMNAEAQKLGLHDTHFANPDGLDAAGHYSSAHDVTRLARIAMKSKVVSSIVDEQTAQISGSRTLNTWNDLLGSYPGVFGVKTGHTAGAGWSEVAAVRRNGVTIYATLLGSPARDTRNADLSALLTWGLARYRTVHVVAPGRTYATVQAPYGRRPLALVASRRATRIVRIDRSMVERVVAPSVVSLPVERGQKLGVVKIFAGKKLLASSPLVASRAIAKPGVLGRAGWYTKRTFHHIGSWFS